MGGEESNTNGQDFQEIGKRANRQSPNSFINSSIIRLNSNTIIGDCKFDPDKDYKKLHVIGEDSYSITYEAQNRITDIMRSMKIIQKSKVHSSEKEEREINNEVKILKKMDHPNIIKVFEFYSNYETYNIVMEYCRGGRLSKEIKSFGPFDEKYSAYIMYQIFSAINYCHNMNIIHRDLKPENIMIVNKNKYKYPNIKIGDFGMSKMAEKHSFESKIVGTIYYMAPEVFKKNYNQKCDIWSCGVIMYVLLTKKPPFSGDTCEEIISNIEKGVYDLKSPPFNKISKSAIDLLQKLLNKDIRLRISAQSALNHPWFKEQQSRELYNEILNEQVVQKLLDNLKKYKKNSIIQETALAYLVHNFPQMKDVINACKLFNQIDINGDGKITEEELYKGLSTKIKSDTLEKDVENIYHKLDMDGDGYIEYEEFVRAAVSKDKFMVNNVLKFAFRFFDKDNSGNIDINEIGKVFKKSITDQNNVEQALYKILYEVDSDRDGKITFEEFSKAMKKMLE